MYIRETALDSTDIRRFVDDDESVEYVTHFLRQFFLQLHRHRRTAVRDSDSDNDMQFKQHIVAPNGSKASVTVSLENICAFREICTDEVSDNSRCLVSTSTPLRSFRNFASLQLLYGLAEGLLWNLNLDAP